MNFFKHDLSNIIHNKIFNYRDTANSISINDTSTFGTGIIFSLHHHHGHIITRDVNSKLWKIIIQGQNYTRPRL